MTAERKLLMTADDRSAMSRRRMRPGEPVAMPLAGAGIPVGSATKGGAMASPIRQSASRRGPAFAGPGRRRFRLLMFPYSDISVPPGV